MPLYMMKEIWTPLKWIGVKLFKANEDKSYFVKVGKKPRKRLRKVI